MNLPVPDMNNILAIGALVLGVGVVLYVVVSSALKKPTPVGVFPANTVVSAAPKPVANTTIVKPVVNTVPTPVVNSTPVVVDHDKDKK